MLYGLFLSLDVGLVSLSQSYLVCLRILVRGGCHKCMIEGLLIAGKIMSCMWVDIVGLQVIAIDEPISLVMHVLIAVVLKTLPIEVFPKGSVGQIPRLILHVFVMIFYLFLAQ